MFLAEFPATTGLFVCWGDDCPLVCASPNALSKRDVLGTVLLAILAGYKRYTNITALRGDAVAAQVRGMNRVISEDALLR